MRKCLYCNKELTTTNPKAKCCSQQHTLNYRANMRTIERREFKAIIDVIKREMPDLFTKSGNIDLMALRALKNNTNALQTLDADTFDVYLEGIISWICSNYSLSEYPAISVTEDRTGENNKLIIAIRK